PETIVQRVKLLRGALGDDPRAPRYIEGVRGRGYRMVAQVRPVAEPLSLPESIGPPQLKEPKEEESSKVHAGDTATEAAPVSTPSAAPHPARGVPLGWIGGTLLVMALVAGTLAVVHYGGASKPAERTSSGTAPPAIQ